DLIECVCGHATFLPRPCSPLKLTRRYWACSRSSAGGKATSAARRLSLRWAVDLRGKAELVNGGYPARPFSPNAGWRVILGPRQISPPVAKDRLMRRAARRFSMTVARIALALG